jgi:mRNA interferase RelE/StbE
VALDVIYLRRATKELKRLPSADQLRIVERVEAYALDPDNPRHAVLALVGEKPTCRLRVGDWRVLFDRFGTRIEVRAVRHRREAYR